MAIQFIFLRGIAIKTKHSFTNTVHSWQVVALPLKSQLGGSFSMALGDIIHVLGRPRCGLYCVGESSMKFLTNAIFSGCFVAVTKPEFASL